MRTVNKIRADMLFNLTKKFDKYADSKNSDTVEDEDELGFLECFDVDSQFTVNSMAAKLLHSHTYSLKESILCEDCYTAGNNDHSLPIISAHTSLKPDFSNFVEAIRANIPLFSPCRLCDKFFGGEREFGQHIFIEVILFSCFCYESKQTELNYHFRCRMSAKVHWDT